MKLVVLKKIATNDPPILPTTVVVRKAKEQRLLEKFGLEFGDPALNLLKSAKYGKLVGSIRSIGLHKFNCIYCLPQQLQLYNSRFRKDNNATLAIDATGSIAKRSNAGAPHIFLYQCVLITADGSIPCFQMVSANQRSLIISSFLIQSRLRKKSNKISFTIYTFMDSYNGTNIQKRFVNDDDMPGQNIWVIQEEWGGLTYQQKKIA
ncbi:unnamed protein product [Pieris brassicae]|uniref:Uncharacterized protein n=1 Tax=Pieris brassicae TaxID=7116 RepID=A0A9P0WWZ1_PIEBR|nr:unnamed protein product [Pieris brassicae]